MPTKIPCTCECWQCDECLWKAYPGIYRQIAACMIQKWWRQNSWKRFISN